MSIMQEHNRFKVGFTLIELLVVISILFFVDGHTHASSGEGPRSRTGNGVVIFNKANAAGAIPLYFKILYSLKR